MLLSLVDILRCPASHVESALVLSVEAWRDQRVWHGMLGCPVCHARYAIRDGVVDFGAPSPVSVRHGDATTAPDALRLAAQLSLAEPGGVILLTGRYAAAHHELIALAHVTCLLLDAEPADAHDAVHFLGVHRLPLADGALRGAAVDTARVGESFMMDVARCVRATGRIVSLATSPLPRGATLVARDRVEWVAEVAGLVPTVALGRTRAP